MSLSLLPICSSSSYSIQNTEAPEFDRKIVELVYKKLCKFSAFLEGSNRYSPSFCFVNYLNYNNLLKLQRGIFCSTEIDSRCLKTLYKTVNLIQIFSCDLFGSLFLKKVDQKFLDFSGRYSFSNLSKISTTLSTVFHSNIDRIFPDLMFSVDDLLYINNLIICGYRNGDFSLLVNYEQVYRMNESELLVLYNKLFPCSKEEEFIEFTKISLCLKIVNKLEEIAEKESYRSYRSWVISINNLNSLYFSNKTIFFHRVSNLMNFIWKEINVNYQFENINSFFNQFEDNPIKKLSNIQAHVEEKGQKELEEGYNEFSELWYNPVMNQSNIFQIQKESIYFLENSFEQNLQNLDFTDTFKNLALITVCCSISSLYHKIVGDFGVFDIDEDLVNYYSKHVKSFESRARIFVYYNKIIWLLKHVDEKQAAEVCHSISYFTGLENDISKSIFDRIATVYRGDFQEEEANELCINLKRLCLDLCQLEIVKSLIFEGSKVKIEDIPEVNFKHFIQNIYPQTNFPAFMNKGFSLINNFDATFKADRFIHVKKGQRRNSEKGLKNEIFAISINQKVISLEYGIIALINDIESFISRFESFLVTLPNEGADNGRIDSISSAIGYLQPILNEYEQLLFSISATNDLKNVDFAYTKYHSDFKGLQESFIEMDSLLSVPEDILPTSSETLNLEPIPDPVIITEQTDVQTPSEFYLEPSKRIPNHNSHKRTSMESLFSDSNTELKFQRSE